MPAEESNPRCSYKEPMMILGEGARAPQLDYQLPQKSVFSIYGRFSLPAPLIAFKNITRKEPPNTWWKRIDAIKAEQLKERVSQFAKNGHNIDGLIAGGDLALSASSRKLRSLEEATAENKIAQSPLWDDVLLNQKIAAGKMPLMRETFSGRLDLRFIEKPKPRPTLHIIEEYRVASFLGNYGAGKTVKTFSLLPGERTKISIKTYRDSTTTQTQTENILDSFTESSADEFEERLQQEQGRESQQSSEHSFALTTGMSMSIPIQAINLGLDFSTEGQSTFSSTRSSFSNTINDTLSKHIESTSAHREIEINTSVTETVSSGTEQTIVRELENINHSRVLNFVFRQLQQEYITLTYLKDIKLVYTNGFPESVRIADLPHIRNLLGKVLNPEYVDKAASAILKNYCAVYNYRDERMSIIEEVTEEYGNCPFADRDEKISYLRRKKDLADEYRGITVPGVILNANHHIVRTDSVIVDALLGQGEALDCYNARMQDEAVEETQLENEKIALGLEVVREGKTTEEKAAAYKAIFKQEHHHHHPSEESSKEE